MFLLILGIVSLLMGIAMPIYDGLSMFRWPSGRIWGLSVSLIAVGLLALSVVL